MKEGDSQWRNIGWNDLEFQCPARWDVIVSGERHLLLEENFQPVLELRYHDNKEKAARIENQILRNLQKENGLFPHKSIPFSWQPLSKHFSLYLLLQEKESPPRAALLCCKECGTTLLFYFFKTLAANHPDITTLFSSLCCHNAKNEQTLWEIQDFKLRLPKRFQLNSYTFAAGMTRLSFQDGSLTAHICRLAPASQRLQSTTLSQLLQVLGDVEIPEEDIIQTEEMVTHSRHPPIYQQILDRFKRKLPFHEIILRHHPKSDRLSGLFVFDKKPISRKSVTRIIDSYEIYPL